MKIAIWHNLPSGGGKRALVDQVRGLTKQGHSVEVWCPETSDIDYLPLNNIVKENVLPLKHDLSNTGKLFDEIRKPSIKSMLYKNLKKHSKICAKIINSRGFDLFIAHPCRFFAAPFIGRYIETPKVLYLQEPNRFLYEAMPTNQWKAFAAFQHKFSIIKYAYSIIKDAARIHDMRYKVREECDNVLAFNRVLVNSYFSRESVLRAYGIHSQVCYLGVDTDYFMPQKDIIKENKVITVGSITPNKNIEFLIEAISLLDREKPKLICIGNSCDIKYKEMLLQKAQRLKVNVDIFLNISDTELLKYLNKSKIFIYSPRLEPFGYTPLEANACEIPVIGVAEGGLRETIVNNLNGILVDSSPVQMASAIKYLLDNPEIMRSLGKSARSYAIDKWSLPAANKRLVNILENVVYCND